MITPDVIHSLKPNEIFIFGSNEAGRHGKGAALTAIREYGAKKGQGFGRQGQCFAIPTKNAKMGTLKLPTINSSVEKLLCYAKNNLHLTFYVTRIGCGLAGYNDSDIAPMFKQALDMPNVYLPKTFIDILNK